MRNQTQYLLMKNERLKTELILFSAPLLWGLGFVAGKTVLSEVSPGWLNFFRFGIALIVLLPFVAGSMRGLRREISDPDRIAAMRRQTLLHGLLLGVLLFINITFQILGLQYISAGKNAFLTSSYVMLTPFVVWILRRVMPSGRDFLCALIALIGIGLLSLQGDFSIGKGELLTLVSPVCGAFGFVLTDLLAKNDDTYLLTWVEMLTGMILAAVTSPMMGVFPRAVSAGGVLSLLYMGVAYTGIAFICQNYGLTHAEPTHASIVLALEAVFGWLFGVLILHETITARNLLGSSLMFLAIVISVRGRRKV